MKILTDEELKDALDTPVFHLVSDTADELGLECYVIGGYVRDLFLERPSSDIDIVVTSRRLDGTERHTNEGNTRNSILIAEKLKEKLGRKAG